MQKRILLLLVATAVAVLALLASGQSRPLAASEERQTLEGSWAVVITLDSPPPGVPERFLNLATFMPDGGFISTSGSISDSLAHGSWVRTGNRQFAVTCLGLSYGADGATEYTFKMRAKLAYTESGWELTGPFIVDTLDATGKVVFSATGTARAFHIDVEKMP
jgi:hypothetical protein